MDVANAWYALAAAQLGARAIMRLLEVYQRPEAIFAATPRDWAVTTKLTSAGAERLLKVAGKDFSAELARLERLGIHMYGVTDAGYPARLRTISDPPGVIFIKGTYLPEDARAVAIVGSRSASPYGRHAAAELAIGLVRRGITIISGMALGADTAAHEGALRAGGRTIAVFGCGLDYIYPPENADLYQRIAASGAIISEYPLGAPPTKISFPVRNRIISGLSLGVVVVEAPERSGALITADHAAEQGREVFAVPGGMDSPQSRGSHELIRNGAKLVMSVEDILEELPVGTAPSRPASAPLAGPDWEALATVEETKMPIAEAPTPKLPRKRTPAAAPAPVAKPIPQLPPEEAAVLNQLTATACHPDDIAEKTEMPTSQVNAALLMLELKGLVQRRPGNLYVRLA